VFANRPEQTLPGDVDHRVGIGREVLVPSVSKVPIPRSSSKRCILLEDRAIDTLLYNVSCGGWTAGEVFENLLEGLRSEEASRT